MISPISEFVGVYHVFSNFYPVEVVWHGEFYTTSEHAYQAAKTVNFEDWIAIKSARTPGQAKRLGSRVSVRFDWEEVKLDIMKSILESKFNQNPDLAQVLIETYPRTLIEGNHWGDRYWGQSPVGIGENHLGRLLMSLREHLIFGI